MPGDHSKQAALALAATRAADYSQIVMRTIAEGGRGGRDREERSEVRERVIKKRIGRRRDRMEAARGGQRSFGEY